ncbi:HAD-IA family hydrolase [Janibacter sp. UYMM211]|uniref:HAD family hydrolase n=1 Tax=Janibacter sp. UYMM211 TaxID=3156342 RepID=UPI0033999926
MISVLLWDCDGVLQHTARDWGAALDERGGPGLARRVFAAEGPALRGETTLAAALEVALVEHEATTGSRPVEVPELLAMWESVELDPDAVEVLGQVRSLGVSCHLATNQQDHRVRHMREVMGYDALVDGSFYSSLLGVTKPDPVFFERVLDALGVPAHDVGFVDDVVANVEAAAALGIRAVHHDPATGAAGLRRDLEPLVPGLVAVGA